MERVRRLPSALPVVFDKRLRMSLRFQRMRVHTGSPIFVVSEFAVRGVHELASAVQAIEESILQARREQPPRAIPMSSLDDSAAERTSCG